MNGAQEEEERGRTERENMTEKRNSDTSLALFMNSIEYELAR